ncbi:tyrosine-protein phosphatase [Gorillibacterium sp. sgz5001074]|uniref:tyrosine-protein phosphatase n=1 Tax=Gorillibacterium sp. sgz5001074 TaxID=3446695 RepID=UPI003F67D0A3
MIDIHCHILHGLDDGPKDLEESVELAKLIYADGIRHVIATPHFHQGLITDKRLILARIEQLHAELDRLRIGLTVHPGHEVRLDHPSFLEEQLRGGGFHFLGGGRGYLLLEQRWTDYEPETPGIVKGLLEQGIQPILPHPERHFFFRETPSLLEDLVEQGAWVQVTADSLLGAHGEEARQFSEWMADRTLVHLIATDAHNMKRRPQLTLGYEWLETRLGAAYTAEMMARTEAILLP